MGVVFALLAIMVIHAYSIPVLCTGFVLGPPVLFMWKRFQQRSAESEQMF